MSRQGVLFASGRTPWRYCRFCKNDLGSQLDGSVSSIERNLAACDDETWMEFDHDIRNTWDNSQMLLNSTTVVHYLLHRGFLTFDSVVDGDLMVVEAPRRNRNFKLYRQGLPGLFVKQVRQWDVHAIATVQREAGCY